LKEKTNPGLSHDMHDDTDLWSKKPALDSSDMSLRWMELLSTPVNASGLELLF
jgi:hypothetical protein